MTRDKALLKFYNLEVGILPFLYIFWMMVNILRLLGTSKRLVTFFLLGGILIITSTSCSNTSNKKEAKITHLGLEEMLEVSPEVFEVTPEEYYKDSVVLMNPYVFSILGNKLLVHDPDSLHLCSLIDLDTKKLITRFLPRGRGPNEYFQLVFEKLDKDTLLFLEVQKQEVYKFLMRDIINGKTTPFSRMKLNLESPDDFCYEITPYNNKFMAIGSFNGKWFQLLNSNCEFESSFGEYPAFESLVDLDNRVLGSLFGTCTTYLSFNPEHNKMIALGGYFIEQYNLGTDTKDSQKNAAYYWNIPKVHSVEQSGREVMPILHGDDTCLGAAGHVTLNGCVFTKYTTWTVPDLMRTGTENMYGYILGFDWEGKVVCRINLTENISRGFDISPDGKSFISMQTDPDDGYSRFVRIPIPEKILTRKYN